MKRTILITLMTIASFLNSNGQWYVRQYHVNDINFLTKNQLEESLRKSKKDLLISGGIAGLGGLIFVIYRYAKPGMSDDPSWFEEFIGDEGVNKIGMTAGAGILIAGTITSICHLGRMVKIKSIGRNVRSFGSLKISPAIRFNSFNRSFSPGINITCNF
jgi:hypothetical protein